MSGTVTLPEARTHTVSIAKSAPLVYEFVVDPRNLPKWAPGLCLGVRRPGRDWVIDTPTGPMTIRFADRNTFGVLDHFVRPESGPEAYVPMRVVAQGSGSLVLITMLRPPDMADEMWAEDAKLVEADLQNLKAVMESAGSKGV